MTKPSWLQTAAPVQFDFANKVALITGGGTGIGRGITAATPMGRIGEPSDVASLALFLASSAAGWVTGQVVDAAGGWGVSG